MLYFWHSVGNRLLTLLSNMLTDLNLTDMETCYKMVRRRCMKSLVLTSDRFGFEPELTARLAQAGARIWEVPISYSGRTYAEGKKIGWKDGVAAICHIIRFKNPAAGTVVLSSASPPHLREDPLAPPASLERTDEESPPKILSLDLRSLAVFRIALGIVVLCDLISCIPERAPSIPTRASCPAMH